MATMIAAVAGLGRATGAMAASAAGGKPALADRLLAALPDPDGAAVIGNALMDELPSRPALDHVIERLIRNLDVPIERLADGAHPPELRARLKGRTSEEFRLGRTATVQGWLLGETEAWLCGLAALRAA
jgi:hypothetical protein